MICALMIGRLGSKGLPKKNTKKICGRYLCEYSLIAAKNSKYIDRIFVSTNDPKIMKIGQKHGATIIKRPKHLANKNSLGEDAFRHGYYKIKKILQKQNKSIEQMVLLFANVATVNAKLINKGIEFLRKNKTFDSAVTTSIYNMWSPLRARKLNKKNLLKPFVPFETFGNPKTLNCDRDSQGDVYYADMSVSIVRPKCLENLNEGLLPQKWMGKRIAPIPSSGGCDVDYEWQLPMVEFWLKKNGFK